jgi:hypothetical protein
VQAFRKLHPHAFARSIVIPDVVRVEFRDFYRDFDPDDNFLVRALGRLTRVEVGRGADLCFFADFGDTHAGFVGCKVHVSGENRRPYYEAADFAIGFDLPRPGHVDHRYLRYPFWAWELDTSALLVPSAERRPDVGPEFCAFVVENPRNPIRNELFHALSEHAFVHAPGALFHNTDPIGPRYAGDWRASKIDYLGAFRFTVAAENVAFPGYTTEKLVDAFLAGSVPIYWGDPMVGLDFNPAAFIDVTACGGVAGAVDAVLRADADPARLARLRREAPMGRDAWERSGNPDRLVEFLAGVLEWRSTARKAGEWRRRAVNRQARRFARAAVDRVTGREA